MELIDSHAHIYLQKFKDDRHQIIDAAREAGLSKIYMPNIDASTVEDMLQVAADFPQFCIPMIGLHPGSVNHDFEKQLKSIENWLQKGNFAAIGEIGMDLYWDTTFKEQQIEAFKIQINWAKKLKLPIVIHNRDAFNETYAVVQNLNDESLTGVFHCFTGSIEEAKKITDLDFYCGIGGVLTFKKSGLDEVVKSISLDHLILETDSPYLAPSPHRGKRNQPAYLKLIAEKLAITKNLSLDYVAAKTTENTRKLFKEHR